VGNARLRCYGREAGTGVLLIELYLIRRFRLRSPRTDLLVVGQFEFGNFVGR
jgi:hypothetical protein